MKGYLPLLIFIFMIAGLFGQNIPCISQDSCSSCMKTKGCSWCKSEDPSFKSKFRCNSKQNLKNMGCKDVEIIFQKSTSKVHRSIELSGAGALIGDAVQLKPQSMSISLRPNHPKKFKLTFRQAEDYPVDLYYLMDLTANMKDHKAKLVLLGDKLAASMINITTNFRLGFGSFVDKVVMPYANMVPKKLENPCSEEEVCRSPYGYKNHLSLVKNVSRFVEEVDAAQFSGNLDDAEGGFDAVMQAIVCKDKIQWNTRSRKIILFATGSTYHIAGDGKLGGIVKPNDGLCHMDNKNLYTETIHQDYPSVEQIDKAMKQNKVSIIFAVPNKQIESYKRMKDVLEGSSAVELAEDSSNIVQLVNQEYNRISSEVKLIDTFPPGVSVKYTSKCLGRELKETNVCAGLKVGTTVEFNIEVELKSCPKIGEIQKNVSISPFGLPDVLNIDLKLHCGCDCETANKIERQSSLCSGNGSRVCGTCQCSKLFYGRNCECSGNVEDSQNVNLCKKTPESETCSGRGVCHCGVCNCPRRQDSSKLVYGEFCECDNFACGTGIGGLVCGGPERGNCECDKKCRCKNEWTGDTCSCEPEDRCIDPEDHLQLICRGHGSCKCGKCVCVNQGAENYLGRFCESLEQKCELYEDCVQCQIFQEGVLTEKECANCSFVPIIEEAIAVDRENDKRCQVEIEEDCAFIFIYNYDKINDVLEVRAQKNKICPEKVNMIYVVVGVSVGVFLIGLLIIIIIRICMYLKDKREYEDHVKQVKDTDWNKATVNPLHIPPSTLYKNPTYGRKDLG